MKKALILSLISSVSLLGFADYYRVGNADTDWTNLDNWSTSSSSYVRPNEIPGTGASTKIWFLENGTSTTFTGANGNLKFSEFRTQAADITFSGVNMTVSGNMINGDQAAGTAENYATTNLNISNGSSVSVNVFHGAGKEYTELNLQITGGSTFTQVSTTWSDFSLIGNAAADATQKYRKAYLLVDKTSTMNLGANLNVNSTHSKAPDSTAVLDIYGNLSAKGIILAQGSNAKATLNIYGSADININGNLSLNTAGATINFVMQDVSNSRISHMTGSDIDNAGPAIFRMLTSGAVADSKGKIYIDLTDFSVGGSDFITGETYAISLISAGTTTEANLYSIINLINEDKMGDDWALFGANKADNLFWDGSDLYLKLVYTAVPEPSTYAAIFGVLALAFAAYRRKR